MHTGKVRAARRSVWSRVRFQLGFGLLIATIMPYLGRLMLERRQEEIVSLHYAFVGTTLAVIFGYYSFRKISRYPGVRASYNIIPSFAISFGAALLVFFMARIDYSRLQFVISFVLCIGWFYIVYFALRRRRMKVGLVPGGSVDELRDIDHVSWTMLAAPRFDCSDLDAVVADLRADMSPEWERFLADQALSGMLVLHVKQVKESLTGRVELEHLSENNFGSLVPDVVYNKFKRLLDLVLAIAALPVALLILIPAIVAIRLDSPGPVFFRQRRTGYRGHPFTILKLRTMTPTVEADARRAAMTADNDLRVTRVGRLLRQYRIDELPQIVNVLLGEMSWIGPRPEAEALSAWYDQELPFYRYRHIVRPGITGWAQVRQGHVAEVAEVMGKLHYDFYYIRNYSFWLDALIVAGTIRTIFNGFGAR